MKTLRRIRIKDENILGKEELKNLKGGDWCGTCWIYDENRSVIGQGPACNYSADAATAICDLMYGPYFSCECI